MSDRPEVNDRRRFAAIGFDELFERMLAMIEGSTMIDELEQRYERERFDVLDAVVGVDETRLPIRRRWTFKLVEVEALRPMSRREALEQLMERCAAEIRDKDLR